MQDAEERLKGATERRRECRECLKLLYEREHALEPLVRDVLRALGGDVEDPNESNREDGWVSVSVGDTTYEGVLEIKSTARDSFGEGGIKQLLEWIQRSIEKGKGNCKGIFIGNSAVGTPWTDRPQPFGDNWIRNAERFDICGLETKDLYVIYCLNSCPTFDLDLDAFWTKVFATKGVFDASEYDAKYQELFPLEEDANE